jgi:hypothetical protein
MPAPADPADADVDSASMRVVQLGFADGSSVTIDAASREARALGQAAARLIDGPH